MKKHLVVFLAAGLINTYAQKNPDGYIVTLQGDTLKGKIDVKLMGDVSFQDKSGKKEKYGAKEIKGYGVDGKNYRSIKITNGFMSNTALIEVIEDGELTLYAYQEKGQWGGSTGNTWVGKKQCDYYLQKKGEEKITSISGPLAKRDAKDFFKDYPEVKDMVDTKSFHLDDIPAVVKKYNEIKAGN